MEITMPTIYITPAGRAAFNMTEACAVSTVESMDVTVSMPVWLVAGNGYTPTDGGAAACGVAQ
jgi:hypothetical protein